jgi:hypothetical protein
MDLTLDYFLRVVYDISMGDLFEAYKTWKAEQEKKAPIK